MVNIKYILAVGWVALITIAYLPSFYKAGKESGRTEGFGKGFDAGERFGYKAGYAAGMLEGARRERELNDIENQVFNRVAPRS
jgi:hypothetical protein